MIGDRVISITKHAHKLVILVKNKNSSRHDDQTSGNRTEGKEV